MKRYFVYGDDSTESEHGEWVKWEDANARVADLEAQKTDLIHQLAAQRARADAAERLLARAQDGRSKTPLEANSHQVQLDYDIVQHLHRNGWHWDAINRQWRRAETATRTVPRDAAVSEVSCDYANGLLSQLERAESELREFKALAERVASAQQDEIRICLGDRNEACERMHRAESEAAALRAEVERMRGRLAGPRCSNCSNLCVEAAQDEHGRCPDCSEPQHTNLVHPAHRMLAAHLYGKAKEGK